MDSQSWTQVTHYNLHVRFKRARFGSVKVRANEFFRFNTKYLSIVTVAGAAISFVVGLIKYLDQRNREERTKRYELYHGLMRSISARGENDNSGLPLTQQVAAVYELQQFPEYANGSIPILTHLRNHFKQLNSPDVLLEAIDGTLAKLREVQSKRTQT